ncbi:guanine nucleotide-binding protein G(s) subunit alpha isoforms XLas-like [Schistocerca nitens]|uniref:guanine nucleotide-binding protein G(s) subunit alpha isoforms XLas-like n=1 Tax=Schistocerca nitens TaxID=7011 RepID=UPI002118F7B2|nr:guanine nucleotide-binding protein G(s) subunit alpha isoforms XLas-like [Schistocerca nitens]
MELVVTLPADVFRCRICFVTKAAGRPTFGEYKDHSALLRHYRRLHDPETVPVFECAFCGRRDPQLKKLRTHQRSCNAESATPGAASRGSTRSSVVGSQAALPSPCVSVQASVTPRTAVVATPASCVLCVRTPRWSGIPLLIRSATSTASPRVPSASSGGEGSTLPTPAAERVAPARGAVSGKGRGSPLPAPAIAPSGVRWPRRAAAAGTSRPPSVGSVGTGLGLPPAFATPPTGGSAMRVDSGRQAASLAATGGVVTHGAAAPLFDAPKAASPADVPDGVVLVRSQTYTRRVSSALPAATSSDARHSVSAQAGSVTNKTALVADDEWHIVTPRRDKRRATGRRPPPPDRRRIIPPSPRNSGPARANASGRPARATPRPRCAGPERQAGPSYTSCFSRRRRGAGDRWAICWRRGEQQPRCAGPERQAGASYTWRRLAGAGYADNLCDHCAIW